MTEIEHAPAGIGDEQINDRAPLVRALVVQRLEMIWRTCEPHINGGSGRPDPRFVEAGIRVLDRLMRLYRLDTPVAAEQGADAVSDGPALLDAQLKELGGRLDPDRGED